MSLYITSLNSGSNGNCYYIGNETEAILVDAGISCAEIEKRLQRLGLPMERVRAVFISHEHTDHVKGLATLLKKHRLPVYITEATRRCGGLRTEEKCFHPFNAHEAVPIGSLSVVAFPKYHDAGDPYSFVVSCNDICIGVFTDIGKACSNVVRYFKQCHAAFLEANYDEDMLRNGNYPHHLKKRISGGLGHLSNRQALGLFLSHRPSFMTHLLLAHLSENNNSPDLVHRLFSAHAGTVSVTVASRFRETDVFRIDSVPAAGGNTADRPRSRSLPTQLAFEFM